jgi:chromosome segregation ATPase
VKGLKDERKRLE